MPEREGHALEDGAREVPARVALGEAEENAAGSVVPQRRALTREIREEHEAIRARRRAGRVALELREIATRVARRRHEPGERTARRGERSAAHVEPGCGRQPRGESVLAQRRVPDEREPARGAAEIERVALAEDATAEDRCGRVVDAAGDRNAQWKAEIPGRIGSQRAAALAHHDLAREARRIEVGRRDELGREYRAASEARRDRDARHPVRDEVPRLQEPARARVDLRPVLADPRRLGDRGVRGHLLAQPRGDPLTLRLGAAVHPDERVGERLAALVDGDEARALSADARSDDGRSAGGRDRRTDRLARLGPPDRGVLLHPSGLAALDQAVRAVGERDELSVEADDADLDPSCPDVDRQETLGHDYERSGAVFPRCCSDRYSASGWTRTRYTSLRRAASNASARRESGKVALISGRRSI